jgi:hypothetical protein
MLYIYNAQGEILYQELFETNSPFLRVLPAETPEGPESLLVAAEDSIWRFGRQ